MFVVTAEKSEKKAPEKGILLVTHSAQSFFPTTFLSGIFSLFNEKFEPFWKKGLDKRHLVAIPTLALTFPL